MPFLKTSIVNKQSLRSSALPTGLSRSTIVLKKGFSLIEVLLSFFFIATLLTMVLTTSGSLFIRKRSDQNAIAAKIAARRIEELRSKSYDALLTEAQVGSGCSSTNLPFSADTQDIQRLGSATTPVTRNVFDCFSEGQPPLTNDILNVTVSIAYTNTSKQSVTYVTQTIIYKNGI